MHSKNRVVGNYRNRQRSSQRGMLLIISLAILFVLLLLAMSLITMENTALRYTLRFQRDNQTEQAIQSTQVRFLKTLQSDSSSTALSPAPMPVSGAFTASSKDSGTGSVEISGVFQQGESIFREVQKNTASKVKNVPLSGYQKETNPVDLQKFTGADNTYVPQGHSFVSFNAPSGIRYNTVFAPFFPYGAVAPKGSIELSYAGSYTNPTISEMGMHTVSSDTWKNYSGVPCNLAAGRGITVDNFSVGKAFLADFDNIAIKGGGIGFSGRDAHIDSLVKIVEDLVENQVKPAKKEISKDTIDKTFNMIGTPLDIFDLIGGKTSFKSIGSLAQAMEFPFPVIPTWHTAIVETTIYFHCPFPPDGSSVSGDESELQKKINNIKNKWKNVMSGDKKYEDLSDDEKKEYNNDMDTLNKLINELNSKSTDRWDSSGAPKTKQEESKFDNSGYPYGGILKDIWGMIKSIFKGKPKDVIKGVLVPTRVIHYRGGPPEAKFGNKSFMLASNWTVPEGRTLKFDCDVTIKGDIWIQDGAALYVNGNLTLVNPMSENPIGPRGKLILGKGSTLVVSKDLELSKVPDGQASRFLDKCVGSIITDSPLGGVNPITSAILVGGNAIIPYGTMPGITFRTLAGQVPGSQIFQGFMDDLLLAAPHVAKIIGPFEHRKCFFASHPASITMILDFIPFPSYLPAKNKLIKPFEAMTLVYRIWLNTALGENLYLDAPWWVLGQGATPILPKIGGIETHFEILKNLNPAKIAKDICQKILNDLPKILAKVTETIVIDILKDLLNPFGGGKKYI
jgi:hypothetical protein